MPAQRTRRRTAAPESAALQQLGERLRQARTEAGLSQAQLGAPYYTRAHVSAIELGKIRPGMQALEFMAGKLSKPVSYFLADAEKEQERRTLQFEVDSAVTLAARPTATRGLAEVDRLFDRAGLTVKDICRLRLARGSALNYLERQGEAVSDLTVAQRLAAQIQDESLLRLADYQMAAAIRGSGDSRRARDLFSTLLSRIERSKTPDQPLRLRVLQALGAVANDLGEPEMAVTYLNSALEWAKDIGDVSVMVAIYHSLAMSYRATGDVETATAYVQRALTATEVAQDLFTTVVLHNMLAVLAADAGRLQAAYEHADRAISLAKSSGPESFIPSAMNTKAECALKLGDIELARQMSTESLALATRLGNQLAAAAARVIRAEVAVRLGNDQEGTRYLLEAADVYRSAGAQAELGEVLMRLSNAAKRRGDLAEAERFATSAFKATRSASAFVEGNQ